jgi:hemerythrin-like metal-binding protein
MATSTTTHVIFPWLEKYSVGIPQIDTQHQGLVRLINDLHAAMIAGQGSQNIGKILDELVHYTEAHFSYEENMLRERNYSRLFGHQLEHKRLTGQVVELREKYRNNAITLTMEVMRFLKDWLANHIMGHDQKYAAEMKTR